MAPTEIHGKPDGPGLPGQHAAPPCPECAAGQFADAGNQEHRRHQGDVEMGQEVHLEADAREEHRGEDERNEITDDHPAALAEVG